MSVFRFGLLPVLIVLTGMGSLFLAPTTALAQHHHHDHYEVPEVQKNPLAQERLSSNSEWQSYLKKNSGWVARWNEVTLMPERAQGPAVSLGEIPSDDVAAERLSRRFLTSHVDAWVATEDLELVRAVEAGSGWWIQYAQQHKGLRVVDGRVFTRLTRLGSVSSFGVLTYPDVQVDVEPAVTMEAAQLAAIRDFDASTEIEAPRGELVILPQETEGKLNYVLAYELRFVTYDPPGAWHAFVDGKTGSLLSIENEIKTGEVSGTLSGNVTNLRPTDALSSQPMPYARLTLKDGDTEAASDTADATGNYNLLTDIDQDFTLTAYLDGPFGRIENDTNGDLTPEMSKTVNTLGNPTEDITFGGNSLPQDRTAYYWSMVSLDYIKNIDADFTGLDYEMPIVTDLANQECNAFWNGIGTTFYPAGPNCANTAMIPSVVIHEYGHGVTDFQYRPFAPSGAMHEGFSDYLSATVLNDPIVGHGFFSNGDDLRRIDVNRVFPRDATGQVHNDGLIIAGALWDVRQALGATTTDRLWHFARYGYSNNFDDFFLDFLMTDDDDDNIFNGTPNIDAIVEGFRTHGIGDFSISVSHVPLKDTEDTGTPVDLVASFLSLTSLVEEEVKANFRITVGGKVTNQAETMTSTENVREFAYSLGTLEAGTLVEYWFTAEGSDGTTVTYPIEGSRRPLSFEVGPDATAPVVNHNQVTDQPSENPGIQVLATIVDNLTSGIGNAKLFYRVNGGSEMELPFTGNGDLFQVTIPTSGLALLDVVEYRIEATDFATTPNTRVSPATGWYSFNVVSGFAEDFEADDGSFGKTGDWEWGVPSFFVTGNSGSNVWGTNLAGGTTHDEESILKFGPVDMTEFDKAALSFFHAYEIESAFDVGLVEVSTDGGAAWVLLEPEGGYPEDFHASTSTAGYSGSQTTWEKAEFDLSLYRSEPSVEFRFRFVTDQALGGAGWYIDDVAVVERQVLARPVGVRGTSGLDSLAPIFWEAPIGLALMGNESPLDGYHVYRFEGEGDPIRLTTLPITETNFDDDTVVNGIRYSYAVTASYDDEESDLGELVEVFPFKATLVGGSEALDLVVDENKTVTQTVSLSNEGTGFLDVQAYLSDPGQTLDDVRIYWQVPTVGYVEPEKDPVLSSGNPSGSFAGAKDKVNLLTDPPPTMPYDVIGEDADDLSLPGLADIKSLEAQVFEGSIYFRMNAHGAWGNPTNDFSIRIWMDTDNNLDTGENGDYSIVAGRMALQRYGNIAALVDAEENLIAVPHYSRVETASSWAGFGFFVRQIEFPFEMRCGVDIISRNNRSIVDALPDRSSAFYASLSARSLSLFTNEEGSFDAIFNSQGLTVGNHETQILIETNDPDRLETVLPVFLEVQDPTPVDLLAFQGASSDMGVSLSWEAVSLGDHLGFHVYRRQGEGAEIRISDQLLFAVDQTGYRFEDVDVREGTTYQYRIADLSRQGDLTFHGPVSVRYLGVSAMNRPVLRQNMPNPVRSNTIIRFGLTEDSPVSLRIYDVSGRLVRELTDQVWSRGFHQITWDGLDAHGRRVSSGVYPYVLATNQGTLKKRLVRVP